jgi:hypothetical protein
MSVSTSINLDDVAPAAAAALLTDVQAVVPGADLAYVYTGAARVGLNRLASAKRTYTAADYAAQAGATSTVTLAAEDDDDARAQTIATALGVPKARVLGKAVCTGITLLGGHDQETGPF